MEPEKNCEVWLRSLVAIPTLMNTEETKSATLTSSND